MVMRQLIKKALRSMWEAKLSYISCIFVITIGVVCYTMLQSMGVNLRYSLDQFYKHCRFADAFAIVAGIPNGEIAGLAAIEGVSAAQGRISENARLLDENDRETVVTLRLIGADAGDKSADEYGAPVTGYGASATGYGASAAGDKSADEYGAPATGYYTGGAGNPDSARMNLYYAPGAELSDDFDILVDKEFMAERRISAGDVIEVALYGRSREFTVKGAVQSPEYIYTMPEGGSLFPDPAVFGVAFVKRETLERIAGRRGVATDLAFALEAGCAFEDVSAQLADALKEYGLISVYGREDQPSHLMVTQEIDSISSMSGPMSGLFLMIAGVILYIMLRRLVEHERTQIGALKAFGYKNSEIVGAYMLNGFITGAAGGLAGAAVSVPIGDMYYSLFSEYFNMPAIATEIDVAFLVNGVLLAAAAGAISAFWGAKNVIKLKPAEAMRPSAPAYITGSLADKFKLLPLILTKRGMMALRFIGRNKLKSAMIVFSIALSFALMTVGFSYRQLMDAMMMDQFSKVQTYDIKVVLKSYADRDSAMSAVLALDGVKDAEAIIELPVTLVKNNRRRSVALTGLNPGSDKYKIMDDEGLVYDPPSDGLLITKNLADKMGVSQGDVVMIRNDLLYDDKPIRVKRVIGSNFGAGCYMDAEALCSFFDKTPLASSIVLRTESGASAGVKEALVKAANVASVNDVKRILENYRRLAASYMSMIYVIVALAALVAFAVIYNISNISLAERQREFATMRVLGLTSGEASEVLTFENWVLFTLAIMIGIPITIIMRYALAQSLSTDLYGLPSTTPLSAFVNSALGCAATVLFSNVVARRRIGRFRLVEVLKERE